MPSSPDALKQTLERVMNQTRPGAARLLTQESLPDDLPPQQRAFIEACRRMYQKACAGEPDYYPAAASALRGVQATTNKSFLQTLAGVGLSILSLGLALFNPSFRDKYFSNTAVQDGVLALRLDLLAQLREDEKRRDISNADPDSFSHRKLIECANKLGYTADPEGICHGFTMRWIEAVLTNTQEDFAKRAQDIVKLNGLLERGEQAVEKEFGKEVLWDIKAFYESLLLYQAPSEYEDVFNTKLGQRDLSEISQLAASDAMNALGGILVTPPLRYGEFAQEELKSNFEALGRMIEASNYKDPVCFLFTCAHQDGAHAVNLTYLPVEKKWQFMDVNSYPPVAHALSLEEAIQSMPLSSYENYRIRAILPQTQSAKQLSENLSTLPRFRDDINEKQGVTYLMQAMAERDLDFATSVLASRVPFNVDLALDANDPVTPLFITAQNGHEEVVRRLLERGADVNFRTSDGATPLYIAAQNGHTAIVAELIKRGADVNHAQNEGVSPLYIAAQNGHSAIVAELVKHDANVNHVTNAHSTPLYIAARNGHAEIVEALSANGANVEFVTDEGVSPLFIASQMGHATAVETLLKHGADVNAVNHEMFHPLFVAVQKGHVEVVEALLKNGADANLAQKDGSTSLNLAVKKGHGQVVEALLNAGAAVDARVKETGVSPLILAAQSGDKAIVKTLLDRGANPNMAMNDGATALIIAAQNGHLSVVEALLANQANPNQCMNHGISALYIAVLRDQVEVMQRLLEDKALDVNLSREGGITPLYLAIQKGRLDMVCRLLDHNADPNQVKIDGISPLLKAVALNHKEIVRELLRRGADPNLMLQGQPSPLLYAAQHGQLEVVSHLLESGANPNVQRADGVTPLFGAAKNGHIDVVNRLLQCVSLNQEAGFKSDRQSIEKLAEGKDEAVHQRMQAFLSQQSHSEGIVITPLNIAMIMGHDKVVGALTRREELNVKLAPANDSNEQTISQTMISGI